MRFIIKSSFFIFSLFLAIVANSQSQTFTTPGSNSFIVPHGITSINAQVWGAGGGGSKGFLGQKGTGGGGGGYATGNLSVNPGNNLDVYVGQGGLGATMVGSNGNAGQNSSVTFTTYFLTATGGGGGTTSVTNPMSCPAGFVEGNGGVGGFGSANNFTATSFFCGGTAANLIGGCSPTYATPGGGGGGSAAPGGNGREAGQSSGFGDCTPGGTGNGGTALTNGGAGGNGGTTNGNGASGGIPGGGGGGNAGTGSGGNGADGRVVISWSCSNTLTSAVGTNNQTLCSGESITNIVYNIVGATGANVSGLPTGVNANYNNGVLTISGEPSASGTFNYTVTPTGHCTSSTATGSITINGPVKRNGICYNTINDALTLGSGSPIEVISSTLIESFIIPSGITLIILDGAVVTNLNTITNNGTIQLNTGGTFNNNGIFKGSGTFTGSFDNPAIGTVAPGN